MEGIVQGQASPLYLSFFFTPLSICHDSLCANSTWDIGIGPKVTQSVITAAFLFAFKDALYDMSVQMRRKVPAKLPLKK